MLELDPAARQKLNQLMRDLRWLITEGYVSEYGDGQLFIPAPQPAPKPKASQPNEGKPQEPNPLKMMPLRRERFRNAGAAGFNRCFA